MSKEIIFKELDCIGFPKYKVSSDGKVYSKNDIRCNLTQDQAEEILSKWKTGQYQQRQLASEYKVSQCTIWRIVTKGDIIKFYWKELKQIVKKSKNRVFVNLYVNKIKYEKMIHRLILEAFIGPCPEGMEACHNDGNCRNNELSNLRWDTPESNIQDKIKHGVCKGERSSFHKLKEWQVREIKEKLKKGGVYQHDIAKEYGVKKACISDIKLRKHWTHI